MSFMVIFYLVQDAVWDHIALSIYISLVSLHPEGILDFSLSFMTLTFFWRDFFFNIRQIILKNDFINLGLLDISL